MKHKHKYTIFAKKDHNNTTAKKINRSINLLVEIKQNFIGVLMMSLNRHRNYTKYLNQVGNAKK